MAGEYSSLSQLVDEAVLTQAFESARSRLLEMVRRRVGAGLRARIDAEGVLQNAYLRIRQRWKDSAKRPKQADLYCWMYGIVRDQVIDEVRTALGPNRDAGRDQPWPDDSVALLALRLGPSQTGPRTAAERKEQVELVRAAMTQLKTIDQEILSMHYFDDLSFPQIGEILKMTGNAVNVRCVRALLKLRKLLEPR
jgi:RNA polymerase sigma-70 factor (ECF subfamily)